MLGGNHLFKATFPSLQAIQGLFANNFISLLARSSGTGESFHLPIHVLKTSKIHKSSEFQICCVNIKLALLTAGSQGYAQDFLIQSQVTMEGKYISIWLCYGKELWARAM